MEAKFEEGSTGDETSVKSSAGRSVKSYASGGTNGSSGGGEGNNNAHGKHDKNGCCVIHSHIQVAKKRVLGSGWKVSLRHLCNMVSPYYQLDASNTIFSS